MINYSIKFYTYWHMSSGLGAGADVDSVVIKDENGVPFIPGKTLKGLIREGAELLFGDRVDFIKSCFGEEGTILGDCHFSNGELTLDVQKELKKNAKLKKGLFHQIASTKIGDNGIAEEKSLREIEVVVPITLQATIKNCPESYKKMMIESLKTVKRMGLNRSRGLGRCDLVVKGDK